MKSLYVYALIAAVGLGLTTAAGWVATRIYDQAASGREQAELASATYAVRVGLDRLALLVRGVRGAYAVGNLTADDFEIFVKTLSTTENFRAIAFLRRLPESERSAYEATMAAGPADDGPVGIWEMDQDQNRIPAPARPLHYVVEAAYLAGRQQPVVGLDVASMPGRLEAINAAIADRKLYLFGPVAVRAGEDYEQSLLLYAPAFDNRGSIVGVVLGTVPLNNLLRLAEQTSGVPGITLHSGEAPDAAKVEKAASRQSFEFGQRTWTVSVDRPENGTIGPVPWVTILVAGAGLASTLAFLSFAVALTQNSSLAETRERLRSMLDGLGPLAWLLDSDGTVLAANESASTALGISQDEMIGRRFWEIARVGTDDRRINQLRRAVATARSSGGVRFDVSVEFADVERIFDIWIQPLASQLGKASGLVVSAVDVTDRHEAQQTQQLLTRELDHRMKNALQVIQAVIRRTALTQSSISGFEAALSGRVRAMARAHELLAGERWLGADVDILLRDEVSSMDPTGQISLNGPAFRINPKAALSFALAMHELGTNALKYGALSTPSGRVDIVWSIDSNAGEPCFVLTWQERDGPPVREPTQRGFGSTLIERSISYELDGETQVLYRSEGLFCRFRVPLAVIRPFAANWNRDVAEVTEDQN